MEKILIAANPVISPFHSPLETGLRSLGVLSASYPRHFDLQRLVVFDHLVVHTGDLGGPASLHPNLPMHSAELLVRRELVERGVMLMISRGLIDRVIDENGFGYRASEFASIFLESLTSEYLTELGKRAQWVSENFADRADTEIKNLTEGVFDKWIEQFTTMEPNAEGV
jgi:hypothetical protein